MPVTKLNLSNCFVCMLGVSGVPDTIHYGGPTMKGIAEARAAAEAELAERDAQPKRERDSHRTYRVWNLSDYLDALVQGAMLHERGGGYR